MSMISNSRMLIQLKLNLPDNCIANNQPAVPIPIFCHAKKDCRKKNTCFLNKICKAKAKIQLSSGFLTFSKLMVMKYNSTFSQNCGRCRDFEFVLWARQMFLLLLISPNSITDQSSKGQVLLHKWISSRVSYLQQSETT